MKHPVEYDIVREIGRGGMASVHEALHVALQRRVAVKMMLPALATDPKNVARFEREARLASSVRHPHIVEIFDFGSVDGIPFLVMELLVGETLAARIARGSAIPVEETISLALPVAAAVMHAHSMGVVHRDLKPANVFLADGLAKRPWPKILDFGISKRTNASADAASREGLTSAESIVGTLSYMAPEQVEDACAVTPKTDQYALAVILYECLTGRLPFFGANSYQLMHSILNAPITPPRALIPELPDRIDDIVLRALERDPANRYPSVHAFASQLLGLGGRATCAQWAGEFAGGSTAPERTQNGDDSPAPAEDHRRASKSRHRGRLRLAVALGAAFALLGGFGVLPFLASSHPALQRDISSVGSIEPPAPVLPVPPASAVTREIRPETGATTETHKLQRPFLARSQGRIGAGPKTSDAAATVSPSPTSNGGLRVIPAETPPPARPGIGTNEAPIFE